MVNTRGFSPLGVVHGFSAMQFFFTTIYVNLAVQSKEQQIGRQIADVCIESEHGRFTLKRHL